jgi:hypothetical protein
MALQNKMLFSKAATLAKRAALSWSELAPLAASYVPPDQATGPTHSQALVRTFGQPEASVRVTLYRDNHAWCPYCQKVWLWLEEKRVPYRIAKVTTLDTTFTPEPIDPARVAFEA